MGQAGQGLGRRVLERLESVGISFEIVMPDGEVVRLGDGEPEFRAILRNRAGVQALRSRSELRLAEAYMGGDIDFEGDLKRALELRPAMRDIQPMVWARAHLKPLLVGRKRSNPGWIAKHYDMANIQLYCTDQDYYTYTPGMYERDDSSLEEGAERKLEWAFEHLQLKPGDSLLEVGCGWGGFARFCARRGVEVTGITLSAHQLDFANGLLRNEGLTADLSYADFFDYDPGRRFDAISLMGVIEDLSDYKRTFSRLSRLIRPGGRIYFDFAAADVPIGISSFITKHVWPGKFRLVYMPAFTRAMAKFKMDFEVVETDRRNYHLWTKKGHDRAVERHDEVVAASDEATFRTLRILYASCQYIFGPTSNKGTAYRMVVTPRAATYVNRPVDGRPAVESPKELVTA